jgi:integrase
LPAEVCAQWYRVSFANFPPELAHLREPTSQGAAKKSAEVLIEYLKKQSRQPEMALPVPIAILPATEQPRKKFASEDRLFVQYISDFWTPASEYVQEKAIEGNPLSVAYVKNNHADIRRYVAPFEGFDSITLGMLNKSLLRAWRLWASKQGLSGHKINVVFGVMRVPVRDAVDQEELEHDPFTRIKPVKEKLKEKGVLTLKEVVALIASPIHNKRGRLAILLAVLCGMRRGEVRGLQWGDIGDGVIRICHNWQDEDGLKGPKRESDRIVPMPGIVADMLNQIYGEGKDSTEFVFERGVSGKPMGNTWVLGVFRREMASIGIQGCWRGKKEQPENYVDQQKQRYLTYHSLRHTYVTLGRMAGISDLEMQALGGHKSGRMMERYSHVPQVLDYDGARTKLELALKAAEAKEEPEQVNESSAG